MKLPTLPFVFQIQSNRTVMTMVVLGLITATSSCKGSAGGPGAPGAAGSGGAGTEMDSGIVGGSGGMGGMSFPDGGIVGGSGGMAGGGCVFGAVAPPDCGNGITANGETCDDGNIVSGDGCSTACQIELGYTCTGTPSVCADIDECTINAGLCSGNGMCINTLGSHVCFCANSPTLAPPVDFSGASAWDVELADFDGNHALDLAIVDWKNSNVDVFLNNGDGTFGPKTSYPGSAGLAELATADFNNDGLTDIAVGISSGISVLLNKGAGTFAPAVKFPGKGYLDDLSVGDFNADGCPDLASAHGSVGIQIWRNNCNGTFTPTGEYAFAIAAQGCRIYGTGTLDHGGDCRLDVIGVGVAVYYDFLTKEFYHADCRIELSNNGNFAFTQKNIEEKYVFTANFTGSLATGDLNGDGRLDVAVARRDNITLDAWFVGGPPFNNHYAKNDAHDIVQIADWNGDRLLDAMMGSSAPGPAMSTLLNLGGGMLAPMADYAVTEIASFAAGDLDGDGRADLVVTRGEPTSGPRFQVYRNTCP